MNTKENLENFINSLNIQINDLKKSKETALVKLEELELEKRTKEFELAITDPMSWETILKTNKKGDILPIQKEFLDKYTKPVNKILGFDGFFNETQQLSFHIQLINGSFQKTQIKTLLPIINPLIGGLHPVKVHSSLPELYKIIPILDRHKGEKGSYSILLDQHGLASVYREFRIQPEFLKKDLSLESALEIVAKKYYFYG